MMVPVWKKKILEGVMFIFVILVEQELLGLMDMSVQNLKMQHWESQEE
jgi:hypothetical protein